MKKNILPLFVAILLGACTPSYQTLPIGPFSRELEKEKVTILDVRTPREYQQGHIPGAINIDWNKGGFASKCAQQLNKNYTIAVYCAHGKRSALAAKMLKRIDFDNVINLEGGIESWIQSGRAIDTHEYAPYIIANHYFVRNDAPLPVPHKIDNEQDFYRYFGSATLMGNGGQSTPIDFETHFVTVMTLPETSHMMQILPVGLAIEEQQLILMYRTKEGLQERSFTIMPSLIMIVDRKYERPTVTISAED